jgi:2-hydroxychromene-2-carboxylate isomerase
VKRLYTLRDAKREADRLGIPFGRAADPLGDGARRCLAVFPLASSTEQQLDLLVSAGRAIWSEGVHVAGDPGLRYVCERAGIDWGVAQERIDAATALDYAEENRRDLLAAGLWGVPCYRSGEFSAWGQDRFWMLRDLVRRPRNGQRR